MSVSEMGSKVQRRCKVFVKRAHTHCLLAARTDSEIMRGECAYLQFYSLMDEVVRWNQELPYAVSPRRDVLRKTGLIKARRAQNVETFMSLADFHKTGVLELIVPTGGGFFYIRGRVLLSSDVSQRTDGHWCPLLGRKETGWCMFNLNPCLCVLSCSTSRLRCWSSSWQTSRGGWSTWAARILSTETSPLATACKHSLFCFFTFSQFL